MFGIFKRKPDPAESFCTSYNAETDRLEREFTEARHIDGCKPSVKGNKVIFNDPSLESKIERQCDGFTFVMNTGSVGLEGNHKIFKNDQGQTHRIEVFMPMRCRYYCE